MKIFACLIMALAFFASSSQLVLAVDCNSSDLSAKDQVKCGVGDPDPNDKEVTQVVDEVINVLAIVSGVIAVIVIIVQGLRMITSGGNPESVKGARNGIIYALIGLVVIISARQIIFYILERL